MRIAVIGAGHGGSAAACVQAHRGHEVTLCKLGKLLHEPHFDKVLHDSTLSLTGIEGDATVRLRAATRDGAAAVRDAEVVFVFYVSNCHAAVVRQLAPHLHSGQIVVFGPGYGASLLLKRAMKECGNHHDVLAVELETLPYSSRIKAPGVIDISSRNVRHPFSALPATRNREAKERLSPLLGELVPRTHVLEVALHNPNLVIHTSGTILNASRIESDGANFHLYRDGFTPSLWNVVRRLDDEKMKVMARLGGAPTSYFEAFVLRTFEDLHTDPMEGFKIYAGEAPAGPSTIQTRYITEDVPVGLGLLSSLGSCLRVPTPTCDALIEIAGVALERDFVAEARTVETLWGQSVDGLLNYITTGAEPRRAAVLATPL